MSAAPSLGVPVRVSSGRTVPCPVPPSPPAPPNPPAPPAPVVFVLNSCSSTFVTWVASAFFNWKMFTKLLAAATPSSSFDERLDQLHRLVRGGDDHRVDPRSDVM